MAVISVTLDGQPCEIVYDKLIMAGYTGRNQAEVQAHIDELKAHGIPAPDRVPTLFACAPALLTTDERITVYGTATSGEAEFVVLPGDGELLIGVGSDHTDRALEASDIHRSKQLCAKPVSPEVWRLADVDGHWDDLVLRSWVGENGPETLYQEGSLARLLSPADLLKTVADHTTAPIDDAVVFSGTFAAIGGQFAAAPFFLAELNDPILGRSLRCRYRTRVMDYLR